MIDLELRPAVQADADAIADVFLACWRGYGSLLPPAALAHFDERSARALWMEAMRSGRGELRVAVRGADLIGVVRYGPDPEAAQHGYVHSLYVRPDAAGRGAGGRLLRLAEERLAAAGFADARLWVFAANARAIAFYERGGWRADGRTRVEPEFGALEQGMARALT